jgi:hypothetical protein
MRGVSPFCNRPKRIVDALREKTDTGYRCCPGAAITNRPSKTWTGVRVGVGAIAVGEQPFAGYPPVGRGTRATATQLRPAGHSA